VQQQQQQQQLAYINSLSKAQFVKLKILLKITLFF
jgi:hypothetical protein